MQVPLPATMNDLQEERLADIENRAELTSDACPSAVFYTFSGNAKNLNCCAISSDCSSVAGKKVCPHPTRLCRTLWTTIRFSVPVGTS